MLGNGRLFERQSIHNLADGAFFRGEEGQDVAAARFGDGVKGVRGGGSAWHGTNIYPYRNMSSTILAAGLAQVLAAVGSCAGDGKAASSLHAAAVRRTPKRRWPPVHERYFAEERDFTKS